MGGLSSKGGTQEHPSSTVHLRDKKDLAGVGIIFRRGADGSLVVKDLIDGSGAEECKQIQAGDTLTQVDDVKISKVSIAEVSGMILGEPGQPVRLKFTRITGRSKRKYKVVLTRTVRATLEPTYRVQKDGANTRVTHIHLDCLQHPENPVPEPASHVRDVLDASGNVVGPGLLEHARTLAASRDGILSPPPFPGVERIDASHPAWPGNKSRAQPPLSGQSGSLPAVKPKTEVALSSAAQADSSSIPVRRKQRRPQEIVGAAAGDVPAPDSAPAPVLPSPPVSAAPPTVTAVDTVATDDLDAESLLKMYDLVGTSQPRDEAPTRRAEVMPETAARPHAEPVQHPVSVAVADSGVGVERGDAAKATSPRGSATVDAAGGLEQWTPAALRPAAPAMRDEEAPTTQGTGARFTAVAVPAHEAAEEEQGGGGHEWEGLAESRIAVFEAKQRALRPDGAAAPKQVDLEKEWARTARAAQSSAPVSPSAAEGGGGNAAGEAAAAPAGRDRGRSGGGSVGGASLGKGGQGEVESGGGGAKPAPARKTSWGAGGAAAGGGGKPLQGGKGEGGGKGTDLAALMAARKKKMEEDDDEGYYF